MSVLKFLREQDEKKHGSRLHWGSIVGTDVQFPFRGQAETLRKQDLDRVEVVTDFCVRNFDLSDADDLLAYHEVMDRVVAGWYRLFMRRFWTDAATGDTKVYVEWGQQYNQLAQADHQKPV
jgi:hypothetical protein